MKNGRLAVRGSGNPGSGISEISFSEKNDCLPEPFQEFYTNAAETIRNKVVKNWGLAPSCFKRSREVISN